MLSATDRGFLVIPRVARATHGGPMAAPPLRDCRVSTSDTSCAGVLGISVWTRQFHVFEAWNIHSFNMTEKYCQIPEQCQIEQFSGSLFTALWVLPLATERKEFQLRFSFFNESCRRMAWKRFSVNRVVGTWNAKLRTQFLTTWGCSSS